MVEMKYAIFHQGIDVTAAVIEMRWEHNLWASQYRLGLPSESQGWLTLRDETGNGIEVGHFKVIDTDSGRRLFVG
jgi:hypothetical protein